MDGMFSLKGVDVKVTREGDGASAYRGLFLLNHAVIYY